MRRGITVARRHAAAWLAFVVSGVGWACAGETNVRAASQRVDSADVTLITAAPPAGFLSWTFTERWRVGGIDQEVTSFTDLGPWNVGVDASGSIYVLDRTSSRVVVLDASGAVTRTFGGEGGGPGEMERAAGMGVLPDGSVWVYDYGKQGMVRFDARGGVLPERRMDHMAWGGTVRPAGSAVYVQRYEASGPDSLSLGVEHLGVDDELPIMGFRVPRPAMVSVPGCQVSIPIGRIFEPTLRWDGYGERVATHIGTGYAVDIYEGGVLSQSLRLSVPPRPVTAELAALQYPDGFQIGLPGGRCTADGVAMAEAQGFADFLPAVSRIFVSPTGEVWVRRGAFAGEDVPTDVWSAQGDLVGTLAPGTPFPVALLPDGALLVVETDDLDVPYLVAMEVTR